MPTCLCYYYRPAKPLFSQFHSRKQQVLPSIHSIEQSRSHNRNDNLPIYSGNLAFNSPYRPERAASESTPSTCSPAQRNATVQPARNANFCLGIAYGYRPACLVSTPGSHKLYRCNFGTAGAPTGYRRALPTHPSVGGTLIKC